jgi:glycosyltransferase involved in cell wall biosynthesis
MTSCNSARTIGAAVQSISEQGDALRRVATFYLSDDASRDESIAVATSHWRGEPHLSVIRRPHRQGQWENLNDALTQIRNAGHDWICYLHDDDIAKPGWLRALMGRIDACSPDTASISSSWDVQGDGAGPRPGQDEPWRPVEVVRGEAAVGGTLARGCWWHNSGCAIRLSAFEDVGAFDPALPQTADWEWIARCLTRGWAVEYIPRTLIVYRDHGASMSSSAIRTHQDIRDSLEIARRYAAFMSPGALVQFHAVRIVFALRRILRSLSVGQFDRALAALMMIPLVVRGCAGCIGARRLAGGRTPPVPAAPR